MVVPPWQFNPRTPLPFPDELDPRAPRTLGMGLDEMLAGKYGVSKAQAAAMNARVSEEARKEGLEYDLAAARPGNTFDAHRLTQLAATHGLRAAAVERFMHAYFTEGAEIGEINRFEDLPSAARDYVAAIESLAGVPVTFCSVGPARGQTVVMPAAA